MKITRTANAGVLIEVDGTEILLDGVANSYGPYSGTPDSIIEYLKKNIPEVVAFTHKHPDHFDKEYADRLTDYFAPDRKVSGQFGLVSIKGVKTGHIGNRNVPHVSYIISKDKNIFFMGDATPSSLKKMGEEKPDILIVPFAYAMTQSAWRTTKETGAKLIILLHLPKEKEDEFGICKTVFENTKMDDCLKILEIGETIEI